MINYYRLLANYKLSLFIFQGLHTILKWAILKTFGTLGIFTLMCYYVLLNKYRTFT